jgi:hypothetical protein
LVSQENCRLCIRFSKGDIEECAGSTTCCCVDRASRVDDWAGFCEDDEHQERIVLQRMFEEETGKDEMKFLDRKDRYFLKNKRSKWLMWEPGDAVKEQRVNRTVPAPWGGWISEVRFSRKEGLWGSTNSGERATPDRRMKGEDSVKG